MTTKDILKETLGSLNFPDAAWDELAEKIDNNNKTTLEKIQEIASKEPSPWLEEAKERQFRHNIICARATLFPGKTIEEVNEIINEINVERFSEGYEQGLEHGAAEAKVDTPEVDIKQIAFEAFSLWRDAHDIKAFKNKFNKWFDEIRRTKLH